MTRVGVVRGGGNSNNYQKSISDGSIILRALREHDDYTAHDILIDKDEVWHLDGVPIIPANLVNKIDICISVINDILEKNGSLQKIFKSLDIPYIHTPRESLRGYIPDSLKDQIASVGVRMPKQLNLDFSNTNLASLIHKTFSPPYSLLSTNINGEVGHITHAKNLDELFEVLEKQDLNSEQKYILEEYIDGDEWAVNVIPNFRETKYYTLHPVHLNTIYPAFRSNTEISRSAESKFAIPKVHGTLDLYAKLVAGSLDIKLPITLVFRHVENKKPVLFRIIERHILNDDEILNQALKESIITEGEYLDSIIKGYR